MRLSESQFKRIVATLALSFATLLCYIGTWWYGFVFDDHIYVQGNPHVVEPLDVRAIFTSAYPPSSPDQGLYRPLLTLSYKADAALFGLPGRAEAWNGFHFTNTILHLACVLLVFSLLIRLGFALPSCLGAALLFAVHPVLSESVAWVVGRGEIAAALLVLLALHALLARRPWLRMLAPVCWLAALLCKESAGAAPLLAVVLWRYRPDAFPRWNRADRIVIPALCGAALLIYAGLRAIALPALTPAVTPFVIFDSPLDRIATAVVMLWKYLFYVFLPIPQSVFHDLQPATARDPRFWLALAAWAGLIWALCRWRRTTRDWRYALLWWIAALFPASNLVVPIGTIFAERFLYLPGLLLYTAAVESARRWVQAPGKPRLVWRNTAAVAGALVLAFGILFFATVRRNADWKSDLTLWESTVAHYPDSFVAAAPYASALARAGRLDEAMAQVKKSEAGIALAPKAYQTVFAPKLDALRGEVQLALDRKKYFAEMAEGAKLISQGQPKAALAVFEALARKYPQFSQSEEAMGDVYFKLNNDMGAIQHYQKAILIEPGRAVLFGKLAQTLRRLGAPNQAIEMYERSLILDPRNAITNYNISVLWNDIGQIDKAIYYMEQAVGTRGDFVAARLNLASLYRTKGRDEDAIAQLREVLKVEPANPDAQKMLRKITKKQTAEEAESPS